MAQASVVVTNFTGGEQSQKLHGRVDLAKYANGCRTLENFIPLPQGGASRRHGMEYINEVKDSSKAVRLVPFEFSVTQAYVLEFGDYYMRVYKDGGVVVKTASDTSAWATSTSYTVGDFVKNGSPSAIYRCIQSHTSGSTTEPGVGADWTSKWVADDTYEMVTPYGEADLPSLSFAQSADTLYVAHPSYEPREITRTGHSSWTISPLAWKNGPFMDENTETTTITLSGWASGAWTDATPYSVGDQVSVSSVYYYCIKAHTSVAANEPGSGSSWTTYWRVVSGVIDEIVTVTSSSAIFSASDVGRWIRVRYSTNAAQLYDIYCDADSELVSTTWQVDGPFRILYKFSSTEETNNARYVEYSVDGETTWMQYDTLDAVTSYTEIRGELRAEDYNDQPIAMRFHFMGGAPIFRANAYREREERHGMLQVTSYTSGTTVAARVKKTAACLSVPTRLWSLGSWGSVPGWPRTVSFHQDRLFFGGTSDQPQTVWGSRTGDYINFETGDEDDHALAFTLVANDVNYIRWMVSRGDLVIGTASGEWVMKSYNGPLTPTNVQVQRVTTYGSDPVSGILTNNALVFVQRGGRRVRLFQYDYNTDAYFASDLNLLADHLALDGTIQEIDFARTPEPTLWTVRSDGVAPVLTLMTDQQVIAWSRVVTDGDIESVAIIPDEVWLVVKRTIGGSSKRYVERITEWDETLANARFLDSHLVYSGTAATTISGLSHLEGKTVGVFDGTSYLGPKTVSSGSITLSSAVTYAVVGLPYTSTLQTNPLEMPNQTGTSLSYTKRIVRAVAKLYKTIGGDMGYDASHIFPIPSGTSFFTGEHAISFPKGYGKDAQVYVRQDEPYPMTVTAIIAEGEAMER